MANASTPRTAWGAPDLQGIWDFRTITPLERPSELAEQEFLSEMIHDARIVPLDGRPHIDHAIRQWAGDSRGHWEGETLVVETTNFTEKTRFRGSTANLHLVERFTRVDADTILYEFTVDDPTTWTRRWSAALTMAKTQAPMYEYACHEGNHAMVGILAGARAEEQAAEEAAGSR